MSEPITFESAYPLRVFRVAIPHTVYQVHAHYHAVVDGVLELYVLVCDGAAWTIAVFAPGSWVSLEVDAPTSEDVQRMRDYASLRNPTKIPAGTFDDNAGAFNASQFN